MAQGRAEQGAAPAAPALVPKSSYRSHVDTAEGPPSWYSARWSRPFPKPWALKRSAPAARRTLSALSATATSREARPERAGCRESPRAVEAPAHTGRADMTGPSGNLSALGVERADGRARIAETGEERSTFGSVNGSGATGCAGRGSQRITSRIAKPRGHSRRDR